MLAISFENNLTGNCPWCTSIIMDIKQTYKSQFMNDFFLSNLPLISTSIEFFNTILYFVEKGVF
jgi:hypothetical protein